MTTKPNRTADPYRDAMADALGVPRAAPSPPPGVFGTPEQEARLRATAAMAGVPVVVARANPDLAQMPRSLPAQMAAAREVGPRTAAFLADPSYYAIAADQGGPLTQLERTLREWRSSLRKVDAGAALLGGLGSLSYPAAKLIEYGVLGTPVVAGVEALLGRETRIGNFQRRVVDAVLGPTYRAIEVSRSRAEQAMQQAGDDKVAQGVMSGLQSLPTSVFSFSAGLAAGRALSLAGASSQTARRAALAVGLAPMGIVSAVEAYKEASKAGKSPMESAIFAAGQAGIEVATELVPMARFLKPFIAGAGVMRAALRMQFEEQIAEQINTVLQDAHAWAVLHPNKTLQEFLDERPDAATVTAIATLIGTTAQTSPVLLAQAVGDKLGERRAKAEQQQAEQRMEAIKKLFEMAKANEVRQRDPQAFADFVEMATEEDNVLYADGQAVVEALLQSGLSESDIEAAMPGVLKAARDASAAGTDVELPIPELLAFAAGTPLEAALVPHLKAKPEDLSKAEAEELLKQAGPEAQAEFDELVAQLDQSETEEQQEQAIASALEKSLRRAGQPAMLARANAQLATRMLSSLARASVSARGDPEAVLKRVPLDIQAADKLSPGAPLYQADGRIDINSPLYKGWWRNSKAVRANGSRVWFHATSMPTPFSVFQTHRALGAHFGTLAQANYRVRGAHAHVAGGLDKLTPLPKAGPGVETAPRVYAVHLSVQNPLRLYDIPDWNPNTVAHVVEVALPPEEAALFKAAWEIDSKREIERHAADFSYGPDALTINLQRTIVRLLRSLGYDGIVYKNRYETPPELDIDVKVLPQTGFTREAFQELLKKEEELAARYPDDFHDSYIVFTPSQVKSATANQGTFDPNDPDIYRQEDPLTGELGSVLYQGETPPEPQPLFDNPEFDHRNPGRRPRAAKTVFGDYDVERYPGFRPAERAATVEDFSVREKLQNILSLDNWAILTAESPMRGENDPKPTPEENAAANERLLAILRRRGKQYIPVRGVYATVEENSFIVLGVSEMEAHELGNTFGQHSVLTRRGLLQYDGVTQPALGIKLYDENTPEETLRKGYTDILLPNGETIRFTAELDWGAPPLRNHEALAQRITGLRPILPYLLPDELETLTENTALQLVELFSRLPGDAATDAMVAHSARINRGWYAASAAAIQRIFGVRDTQRFVAVVAAISPKMPVHENMRRAFELWTNWVRADRPSDPEGIEKVLKATRGLMPSHKASLRRVLAAPDGLPHYRPMLAGTKITSFAANLVNISERVTNDAWMASYYGVDATAFDALSGGRPSPMYLAVAARVRAAAAIATQFTGTDWTPAEVQETLWSFRKVFQEARKRKKYRGLTTQEIFDKHGEDLFRQNYDFAGLIEHNALLRALAEEITDNDTLREASADAERARAAVRDAGGRAGTSAEGSTFEESAFAAAVGAALERITADVAAGSQAERLKKAFGQTISDPNVVVSKLVTSSGWSPARVRQLLERYVGEGNTTRAWAANMTADEFIQLALPPDEAVKATLAVEPRRLAEADEPIKLVVEEAPDGSLRVVDADGAVRVFALRGAGIHVVPVLIEVQGAPAGLSPRFDVKLQRSGKGPVTLPELMPVAPEYAQRLASIAQPALLFQDGEGLSPTPLDGRGMYFSPVERAVLRAPFEKGTAQQWLGYLYTPERAERRAVRDPQTNKPVMEDGKPKFETVTAEERSNVPGVSLRALQWSGVVPWLYDKDPNEKLTKQEVARFVAENTVAVHETSAVSISDTKTLTALFKEDPERFEEFFGAYIGLRLWQTSFNHVLPSKPGAPHLFELNLVMLSVPFFKLVQPQLQTALDKAMGEILTSVGLPADGFTISHSSTDFSWGNAQWEAVIEVPVPDGVSLPQLELTQTWDVLKNNFPDLLRTLASYPDYTVEEVLKDAVSKIMLGPRLIREARGPVESFTENYPAYGDYTDRGDEYGYLLLRLNERLRRQRIAPALGDVEPSTHWPKDNNVFAHMRFTTRFGRPESAAEDDATQLRVFSINELQSDENQKGRDAGYMPTAKAVLHDIHRVFSDITAELVANLNFGRAGDEQFAKTRAFNYSPALRKFIDKAIEDLDKPLSPMARKMQAVLQYSKFDRTDRFAAFFKEQLQTLSDADLGVSRAKAAELVAFAVADAYLTSVKAALDNRATRAVANPIQDSWAEVLLNRAVLWAAQNGHEAITWNSGEEHADRYNMRFFADLISIAPGKTKDGEDIWLVDVKNTTHNEHSYSFPRWLSIVRKERAISRLSLDDDAVALTRTNPEAIALREGQVRALFGDELTDKLIAQSVPGQLKGISLSSPLFLGGGEGMVEFYDRMLPRAVRKLLKGTNSKLEVFNLVDPRDPSKTTQNLGFKLTPELKERILSEGVMLNQPQPPAAPKGPRGALRFVPGRLDLGATVLLAAKKDPSTFMHEMAHYYLEVLTDLARRGDITAEAKADLQTILNETGWTGTFEEWVQGSVESRRDTHERFARGFEAYLYRGEAPVPELRTVFARFAAWLRRVYVTVLQLGGDVSPELRAVMDRMLASKEAIDAAHVEAGMRRLFDEPGEAGMNPAEWEAYIRADEAARQAAEATMTARSLRDARWVREQHGRVLRKLKRTAKNLREAVRAEVAAEVYATPAGAAYRVLVERKQADGTRTPSDLHLDLPAVENLLGSNDPRVEQLKRLMGKYLRAGGLAPDVAAEMFGFDSGEALIAGMLELGNAREAIEARVDTEMLERYGELADEEAIRATADEAIHNEMRARAVANELRALENKLSATMSKPGQRRRQRVLPEAARVLAERMVNGLRIRDLNPSKFSVAARKARKEAERALSKGDNDGAALAKKKELYNTIATRQAYAAKRQMEKQLAYLRRLATRRSPTIDPDYMDQIEALLERFDLRSGISKRQADRRASLAAWIEKQRAMGIEPPLSDKLVNEAFRTPYINLTVEELNDLYDAVKSLVHLGRLKNRLLTDRKNRLFAKAVDEAVETIAENSGRRKRDLVDRNGLLDRFKAAVKDFFAAHRKWASVFRQLDGLKENGVLWGLFVRPLAEASDAEVRLNAEATVALQRILGPLTGRYSRMRRKVYIPEMDRSLSREALFVIALNWGNEANRQRVMDGDGWTLEQVEAALSHLTPEEVRAVGEVWAFLDSTYWPLIEAKERRVYGVAPAKVEPSPVTFRLRTGEEITLPGGYYPIKYDPARSAQAEGNEAAETAKQMQRGAYARATTRRGHAKERVEVVVGRPVRKDLGGLFQHVREVIHDITHHEALIDINRLLNNSKIDSALRDAVGPEVLRALKGILTEVAMGGVPPADAFESALGHIRNGATIVGLGWSLSTALMQPLGVVQSVSRIGAGWFARGVQEMFRHGVRFRRVAEQVWSKSDYMNYRAQLLNREVREVYQQLALSPTGRAREAVTRSFFSFIAYVQILVDMPTWLGAYHKAWSQPDMDEATAVKLADQAVRDSQSSGELMSLARIQGGSSLRKLWTNFYSYFSTTYNLLAERAYLARSPKQYATLAAQYALIVVLPGMLAEAIRLGLNVAAGGDWPEDEEWAEKLAVAGVTSGFGLMVGVRDIAGSVQYFFGSGGPAGLSVFAELQKLGRELAEAETDWEDLVDIGNRLGGYVLHYPAAQVERTVRGFQLLYEGETDNPIVLLTGPPKEPTT